jgi:hypothetical protein
MALIYCKNNVGLLALAKALNFLIGGLEILFNSGNLSFPVYKLFNHSIYAVGFRFGSLNLIYWNNASSDDMDSLSTSSVSS